jgi:hypothetical protein
VKKTTQWNHVTASRLKSQQLDSDESKIQYGMVCKMLSEAHEGAFAVSFHKELSREDIERRAFQIYMARGRQPGNDIADWLAAEKELREAYWRVALTAFNKAA